MSASKFSIAAVGVLFLLLVVFLCHSVAVSFSNWPWTKTHSIVAGEFMGLSIGSDKAECYGQLAKLLERGAILSLEVSALQLGESKRFRTKSVQPEEFDKVKRAKLWHVSIAGANAWLLLHFKGERLTEIERKDYRGPTVWQYDGRHELWAHCLRGCVRFPRSTLRSA